jgi:bifunctional non-homologous end joining protein LigD
MTTGSKGLHVVVPIKREKEFSFTHEVSKKIASIAFERAPDLLTLRIAKNQRKKKVFIDYIRNSYGQTAIAPYSLRAIRKAPVATPLYWDELNDKNLNAQSFNIDNLEEKLKRDKDPFHEIDRKAKSLVKVFNEIFK